MIAYASVSAASAIVPKQCVFVSVDNGKNKLSVGLLKKMEVELLRRAAQAGGENGQHVCICHSEEEASRFRDSNVVAVYDSGEYGGFYSPSSAASAKLRKPDWIGSLGYIVRVKQTLAPRRMEKRQEVLDARLERCATQILSLFAKAGRVSDAELFGTPAVSWRAARELSQAETKDGPSRIRMKSDSVFQ